jgi:hypothetical protein
MCRTPSHPTTRTPAPPGRAVRSSCRPPPQPYRGPPAERLPRGRATLAAHSPAPLASRNMSLPVWSEPRRPHFQRGGDAPGAYNDRRYDNNNNACNDNCTYRPHIEDGTRLQYSRNQPSSFTRHHFPKNTWEESRQRAHLTTHASQFKKTREHLASSASAASRNHYPTRWEELLHHATMATATYKRQPYPSTRHFTTAVLTPTFPHSGVGGPVGQWRILRCQQWRRQPP